MTTPSLSTHYGGLAIDFSSISHLEYSKLLWLQHLPQEKNANSFKNLQKYNITPYSRNSSMLSLKEHISCGKFSLIHSFSDTKKAQTTQYLNLNYWEIDLPHYSPQDWNKGRYGSLKSTISSQADVLPFLEAAGFNSAFCEHFIKATNKRRVL